MIKKIKFNESEPAVAVGSVIRDATQLVALIVRGKAAALSPANARRLAVNLIHQAESCADAQRDGRVGVFTAETYDVRDGLS